MSDEMARIQEIFLDEATVVNRSAQVEHERKVAIYDLLENNHFKLFDGPEGPYILHLSIEENRLAFDIRSADDQPIKRFVLALSPFRAIVREYLMVCDSYFKAIKSSSPSQIEAIDMGRRGLHNDVSNNPGDELAALAWSWAALTHLDLAPEVVFHPDGYKGESAWLIGIYTNGNDIGVPLLQWMGMTVERHKAEEAEISPFPAMTRWLRE